MQNRKKPTRKEAVMAALAIMQNNILATTTPLSYILSLIAKRYADRVDEVGKGFLFFDTKTYVDAFLKSADTRTHVDAIFESAKTPTEMSEAKELYENPNQLKFVSLKRFKTIVEKQGEGALAFYNDCEAKVNICNFKIEYLINLVYYDPKNGIGYSVFLKPIYRLDEDLIQFGDMEDVIERSFRDLNFMLTEGGDKVKQAEEIAGYCGYKVIKDTAGEPLGFIV